MKNQKNQINEFQKENVKRQQEIRKFLEKNSQYRNNLSQLQVIIIIFKIYIYF